MQSETEKKGGTEMKLYYMPNHEIAADQNRYGPSRRNETIL